jgi:two-component system CheB/CheR fusion protein
MKALKTKSISRSKATLSDSASFQFPIVGIGASAGGLEALEQFLGNMTINSGMAFIVIQHLDPTQKGMLPELLQRITKMKVIQAKHRLPVLQNCLYVIPPNKTMSISRGVLQLFAPAETRWLRLPIDFFLNSLATDKKGFSVAVILSGMGSDGSIGIQTIKEKNGLVLVQDPLTAKFDSMPRNAIDTSFVDIIAPATELPSKLIEAFKSNRILVPDMEPDIKDKSSLDKIISFLQFQTGNDFSLYKKNTLYRRIERRMGVHKIEKITSYVSFLHDNPKEADILFKELLIGVTNFFRDPAVWDKLKETVLPDFLSNLNDSNILRAWIPGCSTGEEAYSFAITFKEVLEKVSPHSDISLQIFATDLDNEAIETARKGIFPSNISSNVSQERLKRFFVKTNNTYRINSEIRDMVVFAKHNITLHAPFTKIDFISCRNLLIYMDSDLQKKILGLFFYSLNPAGVLVLGSAETLGSQSHFFITLDTKLKIYKRSITVQIPELFDFPSSFSRNTPANTEKQNPPKPSQNIEILAEKLLLQNFSPPGVLVNDKGDIIYISGRTGKYLEPAVGKANLNIFAMLRDGLRNEFPSAFRKAVLNKETAILRNLQVGTNGGTQTINVDIKWIDKPKPIHGMIMIVFIDVPEIRDNHHHNIGSKEKQKHFKQVELEEDLINVRAEMQSTFEEMQTSQEELKSTNEELQSTNEELQSTNEELTTSKEEMQSLNEELQTVNSELQSKVDDFLRVNNDMKNLLNSTDIATLFLDKDLNIRRFTNQATKIFKLIKSDIGRPFTDLVSDLIYPELENDSLEVLRSLIFIQKQIPTKDERWFSIRIMPYRTVDDRIDGLVITFMDNSDIKQIEGVLEETEQMHRLILKSSEDAIVRLSVEWEILEFNPKAEIFFGRKFKDVIKRDFFETLIPEAKQRVTRKEMSGFLKESFNGKFKMQVNGPRNINPIVDSQICVLLTNLKKPAGMIIIIKT